MFVTFPRSGINYFSDYFEQMTSMMLLRTHDYKKIPNFVYFSIARDPVETITSDVAMIMEHNNFDIDEIISDSSDKYLKFYKDVMNERIDYIFKYEDLVLKTSKVLMFFIEYTKTEYKNIEYKSSLKDGKQSKEYLVSSKKSDMYNKILQKVRLLNLEDHYREYEIAINNSVVIE